MIIIRTLQLNNKTASRRRRVVFHRQYFNQSIDLTALQAFSVLAIKTACPYYGTNYIWYHGGIPPIN